MITIEASRTEACEELLLPNRYHREFFDGLNMYYADDDADDVSIFNFAGRILVSGFRFGQGARSATRIRISASSAISTSGAMA